MNQYRSARDMKIEQIVDSAMKCFCERGFHGASMGEIAQLSGMSKANVYSYFSGKEEIFLAVIERWRTRLMADMRDDLAHAGGSVVNLTGLMLDRLYEYAHNERLFLLSWLEFTMAAGRDEEVRARLSETQNGFYRNLESFFNGMVDEGRLKREEVLGLTLLVDSIYAGMILKTLMGSEHYLNKKTMRHVVGYVEELLLSRTCEPMEAAPLSQPAMEEG